MTDQPSTSPERIAARIRHLAGQADLAAAALQVTNWPHPDPRIAALTNITQTREALFQASNSLVPPILGFSAEATRREWIEPVSVGAVVVGVGLLAPARVFPLVLGVVLAVYWVLDEIVRIVITRRGAPGVKVVEYTANPSDAWDYLRTIHPEEIESLAASISREDTPRNVRARSALKSAYSFLSDAMKQMPGDEPTEQRTYPNGVL